ncbi:hypothetical protein [uncultured Bradyrhizobium sp.]|uniref:hypothetical protein n=1 Tax=uncultured Bradyrhizobium sp. TaxID=199684 RepID=UPI0035C9C915
MAKKPDSPDTGIAKTVHKMSDDALIDAHNNNRDAIKEKKSAGDAPTEGQLKAKKAIDDEMAKRGLTRP